MPFVTYLPGTAPLVLDSPHSGTDYPDDFGTVCDRATLRRAEDTHVEKLYSFAPELGVAWIEAHFPRSYLDANRDTTEVDVQMLDARWPDPVAADPVVLSKVRLGKGLIWRCTSASWVWQRSRRGSRTAGSLTMPPSGRPLMRRMRATATACM